MYKAADRRELEDAGAEIIENAMYLREHPDAEDLKLQRTNSLRRRLVTDVTQAAMARALDTGQGVQDFKDAAGRGIRIVSGLEYGLTRDKKFHLSEHGRPDVNWNFWRHDDKPHVRMKTQDFPYMSRESIEQDAYDYLDLPYRAPLLERTLVDILIALEMFAYGKEMLQKPPLGLRWLNQSPLTQKHVLRRYIGSRFLGALFLLGPALLIGSFGSALIGETVTLWIVGILVGLFVLDLLVATIAVPFAWHQQRKSKGKFEIFSSRCATLTWSLMVTKSAPGDSVKSPSMRPTPVSSGRLHCF